MGSSRKYFRVIVNYFSGSGCYCSTDIIGRSFLYSFLGKLLLERVLCKHKAKDSCDRMV